jgi:hypothetical protein
MRQAGISSATGGGMGDNRATSDLLSAGQRSAADEYAKTGAIPRLITERREAWKSRIGWLAGAGYLRFRKIYGGEDAVLLSSLTPAGKGDTTLT